MDKSIKRACVQGYPVDIIDEDQGLEIVKSFLDGSKSAQVVTINPEMIELGMKNPALEEVLKAADIIIPDGIGVIIILKLMGIKVKRLPGIEFAQRLIGYANEKGYKVGFLGADEETITTAVSELKKTYASLDVAYVRNGYFGNDEEKQIIEDIKKASPDMLFVGLGVPKQELFISKYKDSLNRTIMVGVGGSFDVWAKKIKRAPVIFRKFGLEWFFRLLMQPSRFSRMFPALPLFLIKSIINSEKNRKDY